MSLSLSIDWSVCTAWLILSSCLGDDFRSRISSGSFDLRRALFDHNYLRTVTSNGEGTWNQIEMNDMLGNSPQSSFDSDRWKITDVYSEDCYQNTWQESITQPTASRFVQFLCWAYVLIARGKEQQRTWKECLGVNPRSVAHHGQELHGSVCDLFIWILFTNLTE